MMKPSVKSLLTLAAAVALNACASAFNGPDDALSVEKAHPITVDSQVVTLTLPIDDDREELTAVDKSRVRAFADAYMRGGHGPLTVTAPSGGQADVTGQEVAADVRQHLNTIGVPWGSISGATYRSSATSSGEVILSYTRYVATPSPCGIWSGIRRNSRKNLTSPNFGCATQNNLAAMVADPRDLIEPAAMTSPDVAARIRGVEAFRSGEVSATQTDTDIEAQVAN